MNAKPHGSSWVLFLSVAALLALLRLLPAAEPPKPAAPPAAAPAKPETGEEKEKSLREQSIYIPYEKLRKVFEKEGRGVFLPYEKYRELWQAAQEKKEAGADQKPPVAAVITEAENEATVSKDVVRVKAVLKIEVLKEGWNEVPLRLADAAITEATIGGQPARIVSSGPAGYKLLVEKKDKKPEQIELTLHYAKAITRSPGQNSVAFEAPQAAVSRWKVRIPESGVKVNLSPTIAATEVAGASPEKKPDEKKPDEKKPEGKKPEEKKPEASKPAETAGPNETVILAFVGAAPTVRIEWTPKAEGATGLEALASVQVEQQVTIGEAVTRTRAQLAYTISRAELRQLAIEVPADQKVVNVFDPNVRQWSVEQAAPVQKITVQLFEPAKQTQNLTLELEKFADEKQQGPIQAPVVKAVGVGRQQGVVVVQVAEGLRADATRTGGLLQVDAGELPPSLARGQWAFSYRYASVPFDLQLTVEKVQPLVQADSLVEAELLPEKLTLDVLTVFDIQRAGIFQLEMGIPAGYEVRRVQGRAAPGAQPAPYDSHHVSGKEKPRLTVQLGRKAIGRVGLYVELQKDLNEKDLLVPSGKPAEVPLGVPQVPAGPDRRATGRLVVHAPESLQVNPGKAEGLRRISYKEALEGMQPARQGKGSDVRPVLEYAFTQEPASLVLAAERRKPYVTVRQFLTAHIEDGAVKYKDAFFYTVQYSGVKTLRLDVPAELAGKIKITPTTFEHQSIEPPPKDLDKGYVAWRILGGKELLGEGRFDLEWETRIEKLDVDASVPLTVPHLKPKGEEVDRAWGQIVLAKTETIDLDEESGKQQNLRPIDPQHDLMPGAAAPDAARAYEFHDDFTLTVKAVRYKLEDIKHTSIERAVLRMVVTRADQVSVQALYQMRSAQQRLAIVLPGGAVIDTQPRINGRSVTLEKGQLQLGQAAGPQEVHFVPLVNRDPEKLFLLELRYAVPGNGSRLEYPVFPEDPAVQKVYLAAYLPQERVLLGRRGPWTEEFSWQPGEGLSWRQAPNLSEQEMLNWVTAGVEFPGGRPDLSFPTDGRMHPFSTIRPAAPDEGALRLTTIHDRWLHGWVVLLVAIGGLALLPAALGRRALAIGLAAIAVVLCAVFLPTFSRQAFDNALVAAVVVVLIVWLVVAFWRAQGRFAAWRQSRAAAAPPTTGASPFAGEPVAPPAAPPESPPSPQSPAEKPEAGQEGGPSHA